MELGAGRGEVMVKQAIFPDVVGTFLSGEQVRFTDLMDGVTSVVCMAFYQSQSRTLRAWRDELGEVAGARVTDVMVMPEYNPLYRKYVDNGLRIQTHEEYYATTATLYVDKREFLGALGLRDDSRPYMLLFDGARRLRWASAARFDVVGLRDALGEVTGRIGRLG
jgi:alpha-L-arabinofuranosidase